MTPLALVLAALFSTHAVAVPDDLAPLSDEFDDGSTLGDWHRVHETEEWFAEQLQTLDIGVTAPGVMTMQPRAVTWFEDYRGPFVFKPVSGDVVITIGVRSEAPGGGLPSTDFSLAGCMIRRARNITPATWVAGGEDYVFMSLGRGTSPATHQFEVKITEDSNSTLTLSPAPAAEATLRLARVGDFIIALRREPGGVWQIHHRFAPTPGRFDGDLQVGVVTYTDWPTVDGMDPFLHNSAPIAGGNPDLVGTFDFARFRRPQLPAALVGLDLSDPGQVSDAELLAFLGDTLDFVEPCSQADITTDGTDNGLPDGAVTLSDFAYFLTLWSTSDPAADLTTDGTSNGVPDALVTLSDFSYYLGLWSAGCP